MRPSPHRLPVEWMCFTALVAGLCGAARADVPVEWVPRGVGGGGALFAPSFSPHKAGELYITSDMSGVFHSTNYAVTWDLVNFKRLQGNRAGIIQFTSDPNILYSIDYTVVDGYDLRRPVKSVDGGKNWTVLPGDPTAGETYQLFADPNSTSRLVLCNYANVFFSSDGGNAFGWKFAGNNKGAGCYIGGVFWDGATIMIGSTLGLRVSANNGATFMPVGAGIPANEAIIGFAAARASPQVRLVCVTAATNLVWGGMEIENIYSDQSYRGIYTMEWGSATWVKRVSGITASNQLALVAMARNNVAVMYVGGQGTNAYPVLYKTVNGGQSWVSAILPHINGNILTGWAGQGGDRGWTYGAGPVGLAVAPLDNNVAAFTDYGFIHLTLDGGTTWRQGYVNPGDQNPAGANTPQKKSYHGIGLEPTTCWWLTWSDSNNLFASFSDIKGIRSTDGGAAWSFNYSGHNYNSMYESVKHPDGTLYAAVGSAHDLFQSACLTDSQIDSATGEALYSIDKGATWQRLHNFNREVFAVALDPARPNRMYAGVVHSTYGDFYRTDSLNLGAGSVWVRLMSPSRTRGHPCMLRVLNDGTLACTYSGHRDGNGDFLAASGVFVSTDSGLSWADRSDLNMFYWTKDIVIDPADPQQNTWYVCVFSGWSGPPKGLGGLYRTRNRGFAWQRLNNRDRVASCVFNPADTNELYFTTETEGLWISTNIQATFPTFSQVTNYPFRQPERVFFNPCKPSEIWVTSFGNGLRVGLQTALSAVAEPKATPDGGLFAAQVTVRLTCATQNALIRHTTDGSDPTPGSATATNLVLGWDTTLRVRAFKSGMSASPIHTAVFTFADNDGDALPNWVETGTLHYQSLTNTGTLMNNPDTDGDGRDDGVEVFRHTNPFNPASFPRVVFNDYNGEGRTELRVFDKYSGKWYIRTPAGKTLAGGLAWGYYGVTALSDDYNADAKSDLATYDSSTGKWYIRTLGGTALIWGSAWGWTGATPLTGDYDGDARADLTVFDKNTGKWFIRSATGALLAWNHAWGWAGAVPVTGDYNGDKRTDLAVFNDATGKWFIKTLGGTILAWDMNWGWNGAVPVPGDYNGDGKHDLAVYNKASGRWFIKSLNGAVIAWNVAWGWAGATPVPGDYDGDGKHDLAVYDGPSGKWYVMSVSGSPIIWGATWGWPAAYPVGKAP